MEYFCNPINVEYRYQFIKNMQGGIDVSREAADPSMILFQGKYYIFASMTLGVWVSENMASWENYRLPETLPLYDYAPDVRVVGEYVYFSASKRGENCHFYRTKDILHGAYEKIEGSFDFWDPNLFADDDGRIYFYWGCSSLTPVWGVELDARTMQPLCGRKELLFGDVSARGYERTGEDHSVMPLSDKELELQYGDFLKAQKLKTGEVPEEMELMVKAALSKRPYIEGAWMDKYQGKYYLQYACPGAEYNIYADGVYISDSPLGPFRLAANNPYSYKPGGFVSGAGHGSTMRDCHGNLWHTATMRISRNHQFERRVGIWPAGFDQEGELFCNQRYGDWPISVEQSEMEPWRNPQWYLLNYQKAVFASSFEEGREPQNAVDENIQTWWRAASSEPGQWIIVDLGRVYDVHVVQVNFADDIIKVPVPGKIFEDAIPARYIEEAVQVTRWILEGSVDGREYFVFENKSMADTNLPHDLIVRKEGCPLRYVKLTILKVPYDQRPCISGLRVFGKGEGDKPSIPEFSAKRTGETDMNVVISGMAGGGGAVGYNILWGHKPEKLYHSCMVFQEGEKQIKALVRGWNYYVRVDAFNESGITEGIVKKI